jgi:hypothetical protein
MLELFIVFCIVVLWLAVNGYLTIATEYFNYYTKSSQFAIAPTFSIQNFAIKFTFIFILLIILFPRLLKWIISPFRGDKKEKDPIKIIQEYNFVNSIRDITQKAQEKTENWSESRKKVVIQSQRNKCYDCGLHMDSSFVTHKIPLHRGGNNDISNMKALCESCYFRAEIQNSYL